MTNPVENVTVTHAATIYTLYVVRTRHEIFIMACSGWANTDGEFVRWPSDTKRVHWSYLAEKMPRLGAREGDREGWRQAFERIGIEVFG